MSALAYDGLTVEVNLHIFSQSDKHCSRAAEACNFTIVTSTFCMRYLQKPFFPLPRDWRQVTSCQTSQRCLVQKKCNRVQPMARTPGPKRGLLGQPQSVDLNLEIRARRRLFWMSPRAETGQLQLHTGNVLAERVVKLLCTLNNCLS